MSRAKATGRIPGWDRVIEQAQYHSHDVVAGKVGERVKYGQDYPDGSDRCRDCGVEFGQYHVYTCCIERCAFCKVGQALGCSCWEAAEVPEQ